MRNIGILLFVTCLAGCSGGMPSDLRSLSPVEVRVANGDAPVDGVLVVLYAEEPQGSWNCNGVTGGGGVAKLRTSIQSVSKAGVKPGGYKVVLSKNVQMPPELVWSEAEEGMPETRRNALQKKRDDFLDNNRIIPSSLEDPETTAIKLDVKPGEKTSLTVDLANY